MKLQVSLSASICKNGDRVVVKIKKNQWHVGTVAKSGIKIKVDFDDGADAIIGANDFKHIKVIAPKTKKNKKELTDEQAKTLISSAPVIVKKAAPIHKTKTKPSTPYKSNELEFYLEGDNVSEEWVEQTVALTSKDQPKVLYRLCVASNRAKEGTVINAKKKMVSASDRINNAIYGGCSFHRWNETNINGKRLVVIEIHNPHVAVSMNEISAQISEGNPVAQTRLTKEREFILRGPVSGKVIQIVPNSMVATRNYTTLI